MIMLLLMMMMMNNIVGYWGLRCSDFSAGSDTRFSAGNGFADEVIATAGKR